MVSSASKTNGHAYGPDAIPDDLPRQHAERRLSTWLLVLLGVGLLIGALTVGGLAFWIGAAIFFPLALLLSVGDLSTLIFKRFSETSYLIPHSAARLGETFAGEIDTRLKPGRKAHPNFDVTLSCEHRCRRVNEDNESELVTETIWKDKKRGRGALEAEGGRIVIPVSFNIPADGAPSLEGEDEEYIRWSIFAATMTRTPVYVASFPISVTTARE